MTTDKYVLRGEVRDGMFPPEVFVSFTAADGALVSVIAPKSRMTDLGGGETAMLVYLLDTRDELALVELPGEVYGAGRDVTVRRDQLLKVA